MGKLETPLKALPILTALFSLAIFMTVWRGYSFGISDHAVQIPFIKHILDPTLYPNDPMIETSGKYVNYFPFFLSVLVRVFGDLEIIFFTIHLISVTLFLFILYHLSFQLFADRFSAVLLLALMLPKRLVLGKGAIYLGGMYPSFVFLPFGLLGVLLFLRGKRLAALSILGVTANFHMLVSAYAFCMLSFCAFFEFGCDLIRSRQGADLKAFVRKVALPILAYLVLASPVLIWSLRSHAPISEEWVRLLRIRSSHHSFPFSWDKGLFADYLLLIAFFALSMSHWFVVTPHNRKVLIFCCAIALMCALGVIFAEYRPVQFVLRAQLFRSTVYLTIFSMAYISNHLRELERRSIFHKIVATLSFIVLFFPRYYPIAPIALVLLLILEWRDGNRRPVVSGFVLGAITIWIYVRHGQFLDAITFDPMIGLLRTILTKHPLLLSLVASLLSVCILRFSNRRLRFALTLLIAGFSFTYLASTAFSYFHPPNRFAESWRDVQLWVKQNTPKDALLITPPNKEGFRIFSERSIVGDWKDGTQQYFDIEYSYEWWKRMKDLEKYNSLSEEQYIEIARKYSASYLVVPRNRKLDLDKVYENGGYAVYRFPT